MPRLSEGLSTLASSPWSWFLLLLVVILGNNLMPTIKTGIGGWKKGRESVTAPVTEREKKPQPVVSVTPWSLPSPLSTLEVADSLRKTSPDLPVKILATEEGRNIATLLIKIFQSVGWTVQDNPENASYIFPLSGRNSLSGIRLRYRQSPIGNLVGSPVFNALNSLFSVFTVQTEPFPDSDAYNFVQIEVGSPPPSGLGALVGLPR